MDYRLEYKRTIDSTWILDSAALTAGQFPKTISGLTANTQYDTRCRATDTSGNVGSFSATSQATTSGTSSYASQYSNMTQRYMSVLGAGSQNGLSAANAWPFSPAGWALFSASGPGVRLRLQPGTYNPFTRGWAASANMNCSGTAPGLPAQRYVITPEPGSSALAVIFDLQSGGSWFRAGVNYNTWDGEESGFRIINGGAFNDFESTPSAGFHLLNFHDVTGSQDFGAGGANGAVFNWRSDDTTGTIRLPFNKAENFKVVWSESVNFNNCACMFVWRTADLILRNFQLHGAGNVLFDKHPTSDVTNNQSNMVYERGMLTKAAGGRYTESSQRTRFKDMIIGAYEIPEGGGGAGGTRAIHNRWRRITFPDVFAVQDNGQSGSVGQPDFRLRESVVGTTHSRVIADAPDLDTTAFGGNITYAGSSYSVVQSRSAPMSTNPNSVQGATTFVGSNRQVPSDWALASGPGVGAGVTGRDWGAKAANVGVKPAAAIRPNVYNDWLSATLNQWADQAWYDLAGGIDLGVHVRHGFPCYRARWASGAAQTPTPSTGVARHLFTSSNEFTLYFTFWTSANFRGRVHLIHIKTTTSSAFEAPGSGFTLYFEPRQPTASVGHGNPGYFVADLRNLNGFEPEMRNDSASNLAQDADIDVMDGEIHYIELYCRANTAGQSNGILEAYVDNTMTLGFNNVEFITQVGEQFNQVIVAPYLSSNEGLPTQTVDLFMGDDLRLFNKDW